MSILMKTYWTIYDDLKKVFPGYLAEINFIDGQVAADPSYFGETDSATGGMDS